MQAKSFPSVEGGCALARPYDCSYNQGGVKVLHREVTGKETIFMTDLKQFGEGIINNLEKVIVGKYQAVELVVIGLLCQGHVLI